MTFHPDTLDADTLRRLAKNLKQRAATVLPTPLKLSQAQELLAGAMGHPDWHAALKRATATPSALKAVPQDNADPHQDVLHNVVLRADFFEHMAFMADLGVDELHALKGLAEMYGKQGGQYGPVAAYINASILPVFNKANSSEISWWLGAEIKRFSEEEAMAWTLGHRVAPQDRWKLVAERAARSKAEYLARKKGTSASYPDGRFEVDGHVD